MKKLLLVILIGFVSACASIERENLYNALTTWQGAPIEEYLAGHRSPDEVLQIANYTLYKWSRSSSGAIPMPVNTNCSTTGVSAVCHRKPLAIVAAAVQFHIRIVAHGRFGYRMKLFKASK